MIDRLFDFFRELVDEEPQDRHPDSAIALAAVALMLEVARSDESNQSAELDTIRRVLADDDALSGLGEIELEEGAVRELINAATDRVEAAHDLYQFTQVINDCFSYAEKEKLVHAMWLVAFADGRLESIEDHIIRRVAGLLHIAHEDFIRLKIKARQAR